MGVPGRGLHLSVSKKLADHGQAFAKRQRPVRKVMPEVMNSHVFKLRALADAPPWPLQVGEMRARKLARDDPGIVVLSGDG